MVYSPSHMKWWGWGNVDATFSSDAHPSFWPYAKSQLGIEREAPPMPPVPFDSVHLPEPTINHRFLDELRSTMHGHQICDSRYERVVHACGKGFRDLQENGGAIKYEGKWDLLGDAAQSGVCRGRESLPIDAAE